MITRLIRGKLLYDALSHVLQVLLRWIFSA